MCNVVPNRLKSRISHHFLGWMVRYALNLSPKFELPPEMNGAGADMRAAAARSDSSAGPLQATTTATAAAVESSKCYPACIC